MRSLAMNAPPAPAPTGRLLNARGVAHEIFGDMRSAAWVKRHVPGKIRLGHSTVVWAEEDVWAWIRSQKAA